MLARADDGLSEGMGESNGEMAGLRYTEFRRDTPQAVDAEVKRTK